jgi:hypothetical protein
MLNDLSNYPISEANLAAGSNREARNTLHLEFSWAAA